LRVECSFLDDDRTKPIPYQKEIRVDSINYGFMDLKSNPDLVNKVPEAKELVGLVALLSHFSERQEPYFSIGCEKATWIGDNDKYNTRGYVEFALNYEKIAHRRNYLTIFDRFVTEAKRSKVRGLASFEWQVSPVSIEKLGITIYSCTIWTMISDQPSDKISLKRYDEAMWFLKRFFSKTEVPHASGKPIF